MIKLRETKLESVKLNLATRLPESSIINDDKLAIQLIYSDVFIAVLTKIMHFFV